MSQSITMNLSTAAHGSETVILTASSPGPSAADLAMPQLVVPVTAGAQQLTLSLAVDDGLNEGLESGTLSLSAEVIGLTPSATNTTKSWSIEDSGPDLTVSFVDSSQEQFDEGVSFSVDFNLNEPAAGGEEVTLNLSSGDLSAADFGAQQMWSVILEAGATGGSFTLQAAYDGIPEGRSDPAGELGTFTLGGDIIVNGVSSKNIRITDPTLTITSELVPSKKMSTTWLSVSPFLLRPQPMRSMPLTSPVISVQTILN